jgi:colicin import membrane protein
MGRSVFVPLTVSLLLHLAIIVLLLLHVSFSEPPMPAPPLNIVQAQLVKLDAIPKAKPPPAPKPADNPPPQAQPEPPKPPEPKPEPPKPEPPKPEPPKPDPLKQKLELEKAKAEQAKKAEQQKKEEAERKRKDEEQRKKQQQEALRKQQEQREKNELAKAMAQEEAALEAASDAESVTTYQALIQRAVTNNWSRPPSARNGMRVILLIQMIPTGEIVDASVVTSSGNDAFDRSAVAAVKKTAQIPELRDLKRAEFERYFRRFQLDFHPEDLRQ